MGNISGKRVGEILHDEIWSLDGGRTYRLIMGIAMKNVPLEFDRRHIPQNLLEVNREAVRVYRAYLRGKYMIVNNGNGRGEELVLKPRYHGRGPNV